MLCLASLALPVLLLAQTPPSEAQTTFAQSIYRQGFRLAATPLAIRQTRLAGTCAAVCSTYAGCVSVNYKVSTGECELLGAFLCQDEVTNLQPATDWAYYDMEPTQDAYVFAPLLMSDACQTSGICSTKCGRSGS
ncbi:uncharacterized protein [Penaeus vannamei]|uniref:uncharacterized protein n=1 Tax=Penaeus vannamei TaxID=6689 RepID=UPI00387F3900